jgi:acyl-coenzyme A thioesterase PaaI-like protein
MRVLPPAQTEAYDRMIAELRGFLDGLAGAHPDEAMVAELSRDLAAWSERLGRCAVEEPDQLFARVVERPGRGQVMSPLLFAKDLPSGEMTGHVTFGRYFMGVNGAAHGGAVALLFDEALGRAASGRGGPRARTAYLHVDFRAVTPIDTKLAVRSWLDRVDGRKRFVRGELRHGEVICAEAKALFVELKPGQG